MSNDIMAEKSDRVRAIREAQFALFGLQSDEKKLERVHTDLEQEIRRMQMDMSRLKSDIEGKQSLLKSAEQKWQLAKEDSARAKKKMNNL